MIHMSLYTSSGYYIAKLISNATLLFFGFAIASSVRFLVHLLTRRWYLSDVPGPRPSSWIWGEEWLLYHTKPGSLYVDWHKRFGNVVVFTGAFGHQVLSITDPKAISYILGEAAYSFPKPNGVRAWFKATLGEGILWVEGKEAHEKQRRILAPALSPSSVRNLTYVLHETSNKLVSQWAKIIDESQGDQAEIEVTFWAGRFALDTVSRAAFSYDLGCLSGEPHALAETLDSLTNNENKLSSFYIRALFWIFPAILHIGVKGQMIRQTKQELGDIARKMWRDAAEVRSVNAGEKDDTISRRTREMSSAFGADVGIDEKTMMGMIMKANDLSNQTMDEEFIVSQMRTAISAGYETITAIICWLLYELAVNPSVQTELREETVAASDATLDSLNSNYPLLDAVIKETLRLHPAILENHHEAGETITIPLSTPLVPRYAAGSSAASDVYHLTVPKGTLIVIPVNVIQTDPNIWGTDANVWRPQRWFERKKSGIKMTRDMFTFSEGPRSCIGKTFAIAELKILLVTLIQQFSFTCPYDIQPFQSFVIRPRIKGQGPSSLPLLVKRL